MLGKLLKYDWKSNYLYLLVGYAVYIVLTISFTLSIHWIQGSTLTGQLEETLQMLVVISSTFLWFFSIVGVVLMTYILIVRRFYCNMVTDQGYLTLTLPVSVRTHMLSKLISALIFLAMTACVLLAGVLIVVIGVGQSETVVRMMDAVGRLMEELGLGFTILLGVNTILSMVQAILLIYFSICLGQRCAKHKVWGSIGAYLGIQFGLSLITNFVVLISTAMGENVLLSLYTGNGYSLLNTVFLILQIAVYFFLGSWLLEKRANLE